MKKKDLLLTLALLLLFSSCAHEDDKYPKSSALSIKSVYAVSPETYSGSSDRAGAMEEFEFWCTGNDIKWYNATTGELEFHITPPAMTGMPPYHYQYLAVFLDDKELIRFETVSGISSIATAHPCITFEPGEREYMGCTCGNKQDHHPVSSACESIYKEEKGHYYISKGYPRWGTKERNEDTAHGDWSNIDAEREKNWKAIEPAWTIFMDQLKKEGRYKE